MYDRIEKLGGSTIQHGPLNDRIYLMKLTAGDYPDILHDLDEIAHNEGYTKIFAKVPSRYATKFEQFGYQQEALVPRFYNSTRDAAFLGRFFSEERRVDTQAARAQQILRLAEEKRGEGLPANRRPPMQMRAATPDDVREISEVYRKVFPTYPFPIHDPEYLLKTMERHVKYFCVCKENRIVSLSSAEIDAESQNAEMTDFATLPEYRGGGLGSFLLFRMESEMKALGIRTLYTIARALSAGMNVVFARLGYVFGGTLVNNTAISGHIESMNVWYKHLPSQGPTSS